MKPKFKNLETQTGEFPPGYPMASSLDYAPENILRDVKKTVDNTNTKFTVNAATLTNQSMPLSYGANSIDTTPVSPLDYNVTNVLNNVENTLDDGKSKDSSKKVEPLTEPLTEAQQKYGDELETISKFNTENGTNIGKIEQIPEAEKILQDEKTKLEVEEGKKQHPKRAAIIDAINAANTDLYGDSLAANHLRSKGLYNQANDFEQEGDKKKALTSGIALATPLFISGIAGDLSYGALGAAGKLGGGFAGSYAGEKVGEKIGKSIDSHFNLDNKFETGLPIVGSLAGGGKGAKIGYNLSKNTLAKIMKNQMLHTGTTTIPKGFATNKMKSDLIGDAFKSGGRPSKGNQSKYNTKQLSNIDDQGYGFAYKNGGVIKLQGAGTKIPSLVRRAVPETFSRVEPGMVNGVKATSDDGIIKRYLDTASKIAMVTERDPGGLGVPIYRQQIDPYADSYTRDKIWQLGTMVKPIIGDGFDYTNIATPERMREMIRRVSKHPFVQNLQGFVINPNSNYGVQHNVQFSRDNTNQTKVINTPFDISHMYGLGRSPYPSPELSLSIKASDSDGSITPEGKKLIFADLSPFVEDSKINDVFNTYTKNINGKLVPDPEFFAKLENLYYEGRSNNTERAQELEEEGSNLVNNTANQQRGRRMTNPVFDPNLAESRVVETNKSADSEKVTLHMGAKYGIDVDDSGRKIITPRHSIEVIPVLRFEKDPISGEIKSVPVRSTGNTMHKSVLRYNNGQFTGGGAGEKSLKGPLNEENYDTAYQLFSDDLLDPLNKSIKKINEHQGLQIQPAVMEKPSFEHFQSEFNSAKPKIDRDLLFLRYHTIPE